MRSRDITVGQYVNHDSLGVVLVKKVLAAGRVLVREEDGQEDVEVKARECDYDQDCIAQERFDKMKGWTWGELDEALLQGDDIDRVVARRVMNLRLRG